METSRTRWRTSRRTLRYAFGLTGDLTDAQDLTAQRDALGKLGSIHRGSVCTRSMSLIPGTKKAAHVTTAPITPEQRKEAGVDAAGAPKFNTDSVFRCPMGIEVPVGSIGGLLIALARLGAAVNAPDRVRTVSYGKEKPVATGHDETAWAQNRRAVTVVVR